MSHPSTPRPPARRSLRGLAVLAVALAALTACGGDDDGGEAAATTAAETSSAESSAPASSEATSPAPAEAQTVTATEGEMFIELSQEEFTAGSVTIEVTNDGSASHDLVVERDGSDVGGTEMIGPGESATLTVELEPGEYVFYCSVGNHRAMGMEVAVTVT